jgi:hypothetical protein
MSTPIPKDAKKFRMGILPLTGFIFAFGCLLGYTIGIPAILMQHGQGMNLGVFLKSISISLPVMLVLAFAFAVMISLLFTSYISAQGIHGHSFWGARSFLAWTDIARAKKLRLANLVYARLYSGSGGATIWFPLFQSPRAYFQDEIRRFAPKDSLILNHLK